MPDLALATQIIPQRVGEDMTLETLPAGGVVPIAPAVMPEVLPAPTLPATWLAPEFELTVTQDDIKRGVRRSAGNCPIALAVRRLVGWPLTDHGSKMDNYGWLAIWSPVDHAFLGWYYSYDAGRWADRFDEMGRSAILPRSFWFRAARDSSVPIHISKGS